MNIDQFGIIRDPSGTKVAVFKDPSLGQCLIDRAGLLSADEAAELTKVAVGAGIKLNIRRVTMWEVV